MRVWGLLAVAILIAGCTTAKTEPPVLPEGPGPDPVSARHCGTETLAHGNGYDARMRECLWKAVGTGEPVTFRTTVTTVEGDPIAFTLEARAPSYGPGPRFTLLVDSQDHFGRMGQFTYACKSLERVAYSYQSEPRYSFHLSDCTGTGGEPETDIP